MTIDEAIKHYKEEAEKYMEYGIETECYQCGKENEQLAEWLTELKELRKLLKTAIDTLENVMPKYRRLSEENQKQKEQIAEYKRLLKAALADMNNGGCNSNCYKCKHCGACDYSERFTWKFTDEAEKLIGGSENE